MARLRLVFMGTPEFALPALIQLIDAGHEVIRVYTRPPRAAGRGGKERRSPVHDYASGQRLEVRTPTTLRCVEEEEAFAQLEPDAAVVVAYGLMLPPAILDATRLGCLNLHASLLPRWRGAAPIQRALMAGDRETGVTVMLMDEGLDSGPVLSSERLAIAPDATLGRLHDELARIGAELLVRALAGLDEGRLEARPQPSGGVTHAPKLSPDEGRLDWRRPAAELERLVRALCPRPGAWFRHRGTRIKVPAAEVVPEAKGAPGEVLDERLTVACGAGALRPKVLQREGKAAMAAAEFLRGFPLGPGAQLE